MGLEIKPDALNQHAHSWISQAQKSHKSLFPHFKLPWFIWYCKNFLFCALKWNIQRFHFLLYTPWTQHESLGQNKSVCHRLCWLHKTHVATTHADITPRKYTVQILSTLRFDSWDFSYLTYELDDNALHRIRGTADRVKVDADRGFLKK